MYKIAVIGASDTVLGFKALGLETHPVSDKEEARRIFRQMIGHDEKYAIIYIEEKVGLALADDIEEVVDRPVPAVILIPGREGSMGIGLSALQNAVIRAVGADVL